MKTKIEELEAKLKEMQDELTTLKGVPEEKKSKDKWEPIAGEYFVNIDGEVSCAATNLECKLFGTERQSKEAAERASKEMRIFNRLLAYRDEFDPDFEYDESEENYYIEQYNGTYSSDCDCDGEYRRIGVVYFSYQVAKLLVYKLNFGEVVL